ncbi:hypothetical protein Tco_0850072 [Tanacetum coccineum]
MTISFRSLNKSVVNITNTSTNKAFQILVDPSRLQSPFNCRNELFAPCHILLSPEACIHTRIEPHDLEFLYSVNQYFRIRAYQLPSLNLYIVRWTPMNHSFIVVDNDETARLPDRLNDGIIMLELDTVLRNPFNKDRVFLGDQLLRRIISRSIISDILSRLNSAETENSHGVLAFFTLRDGENMTVNVELLSSKPHM